MGEEGWSATGSAGLGLSVADRIDDGENVGTAFAKAAVGAAFAGVGSVLGGAAGFLCGPLCAAGGAIAGNAAGGWIGRAVVDGIRVADHPVNQEKLAELAFPYGAP